MTHARNQAPRFSRRRLLWSLLAATLVTAAPALAQDRTKIVITGSSTVAPLIGDVARRYEELNPGILVDVQSGGSSRGIGDVRREMADIGMVSRALHAEETDLHPTTVAIDGLTLVVHSSNPIAALDDDTVRAIFTGEITRWEEIDPAAEGAITVVNKADGRSTLEIFLAHLDLDPSLLKSHVVIGENQQGIKTVAGNRGAIGYVSIGAAEFAISIDLPLKMIPLGPVAPTSENVANGTYGAVRALNLVTLGPPQDPAVADFLAFATSEKVHDLVSAHYLVASAD